MNYKNKLKHILLIDDDELNNYLSKEIIGHYNEDIIVSEVISVEKAIVYLDKLMERHECFPDVILLDINMPKLDGWDFLNILKKYPDDLLMDCKIYIYTSSVYYEDIKKANAHELVIDIFTKPITQEKIKDILG